MKTIKKGILTLAMATCLSLGLSVSAAAAETKEVPAAADIPASTAVSNEHNIPFTALTPSAQEVPVSLNGELLGMDTPAHAFEGTTYVAAGAMVRALYPEAASVCTAQDMEITAPNVSVRIRAGQDFMEVNGAIVDLGMKSVMMDTVVMVPLRPLCEALGAQVGWDAENGVVTIQTREVQDLSTLTDSMKDKGVNLNSYKGAAGGKLFYGGGHITDNTHTGNGHKFVGGQSSYGGSMSGGYSGGSYSEEDVYWLSRIIEAESGNQSMDGKIGVGNVIMNRVESDAFPDTVEGVVFQNSQFTTVSNGSIYNEPSQESIDAARQVLAGSNTVGDALYFNNTTNCWAGNNRTMTSSIGGHYFFS